MNSRSSFSSGGLAARLLCAMLVGGASRISELRPEKVVVSLSLSSSGDERSTSGEGDIAQRARLSRSSSSESSAAEESDGEIMRDGMLALAEASLGSGIGW